MAWDNIFIAHIQRSLWAMLLVLQRKDSDQDVFLAKKNTVVLKTVLTGYFCHHKNKIILMLENI